MLLSNMIHCSSIEMTHVFSFYFFAVTPSRVTPPLVWAKWDATILGLIPYIVPFILSFIQSFIQITVPSIQSFIVPFIIPFHSFSLSFHSFSLSFHSFCFSCHSLLPLSLVVVTVVWVTSQCRMYCLWCVVLQHLRRLLPPGQWANQTTLAGPQALPVLPCPHLHPWKWRLHLPFLHTSWRKVSAGSKQAFHLIAK